MESIHKPLIGKTIEVDVGNAVYGGNFVGRAADGKAIFVPYTLPGEHLEVLVTEEKKDFARADLIRVIEASGDRINARCRHFGVCGGCHYQHVPYALQLELKRSIILDQFKRIGKFSEPVVEKVIPSPVEWNYRNTVQFHVTPTGSLGFQKAHSAETLEITECHLPAPAILDLWEHLELDAELVVSRAFMRAGLDGEVQLGLECAGNDVPDLSLDFPLSVVLIKDDQDLLLSGEPSLRFVVKGIEFLVSARSFFQVNLKQAEASVEHVLAQVNWTKEMTVFDLYSGVGLFSRFIAPLVKELVGIEISESACDDFTINLDAFENTSLYVGSVEQILPHLEQQPSVVVVDPPRAGLASRVIETIVKSSAKQIIYISCDPTTLARDCRSLVQGGFDLTSIQPFDMFPQTYHIETVCFLTKREG